MKRQTSAPSSSQKETRPVQASTDIARLLRPESIAIVGASEDQSKFGGRLLRMVLRHRFAGPVYPINAKRDTLFDIKAYPDFDALPAVPDMAVLAVPQASVKGTIEAA